MPINKWLIFVSSADLSNLEDHLIAISDDIGSLYEKPCELRESISKLRTRTMMEVLSEKLDQIRELLEQRDGSMDHVEFPNGDEGWPFPIKYTCGKTKNGRRTEGISG